MNRLLLPLLIIVLFGSISHSLFSQNKSDLDTSLLGAVKRNDLVLVKKLISNGADVNFRDENNATVLMWAVYRNNLPVMKYLISKGADINVRGTFDTGSLIFNNALSVAVHKKNAETVYYLLNKCKCSVSKNDITFVDKSIPGRRFDLSDFSPANPADGRILSYLFLKGLKIRLFDLISFEDTEWAAKDYLKFYFDSLFITDAQNRTLLHAAARYNRIDLARYLINHGVEVDAVDDSGISAYYLSRSYDNREFMKLLTENGADTAILPYSEEVQVSPSAVSDAEVEQSLEQSEMNAKPVLGLPLGHTDRITRVTYTIDGKLIVTASTDNTAKIWEASSGKLLHSLEGHTAWVNNASFSPDTKFVITQSMDQTVKIWNTITGSLINSFPCENTILPYLCPEGKTIFVATNSYLLRYNILSGKIVSSFNSTDAKIKSFSAFNNGADLLINLSDSTAKVLDVVSGKIIHTFKGVDPENNPGIKTSFFSKKYLILVSEDSTGDVYEINSWKYLYSVKGHKNSIVNAVFSLDEYYFFTKSYLDNTVKVWDASDGSLLFTIDQNQGSFPEMTFSPDGKFVYSTQNEDVFRMWELPSGKLLCSIKIELVDAQYLTDEHKIVLVGHDSLKTLEIPSMKLIRAEPLNYNLTIFSRNTFSPDHKFYLQDFESPNGFGIRCIDMETGKTKEMAGHAMKILSADFSMGNDSLIVVSERGTRIIDRENGRIKSLFPSSDAEKTFISPDKKLVAVYKSSFSYFEIFDVSSGKKIIHDWIQSEITDVDFSPEGKLIAVSSLDNSISIRDRASGKVLKKLTDLDGGVSNVSYSRDGKYLAAASLNGNFKVWKTADYSVLLSVKGHDDAINSIEFSHNGNFAVTASNDTSAKVWDMQTGKLLSSLKAGHEWISNAVFSPDDRFIITSSSYSTRTSMKGRIRGRIIRFAGDPSLGTIRVWDPLTGDPVSVLEGHSGGVEDVSFSPDNKYLITASADRMAIIWDCSTWKMLYRLEGHSSKINSARFSSDSKFVLTASDDSRVKIWDTSSGKEVLTWIAVDSTDWVVLSPTGLFDATPGALKLMYYVQGLDVIDLEQLKERYYEPNLWSKLTGFNPEPLRDVEGLGEIKMYPSLTLKINNDNLVYSLTDRGGGIGKYLIYINGKEVFSGNQPGDSLSFRGGNSFTASFSLKNHPYLIPGRENEIMIKAYNGENYLVSRGEKISYISEGPSFGQKPRLFIISSGISDYTGELIDLKYAAKDAEDMTQALDIGAARLFGTDATYTFKLTTANPDRNEWPTKINIERAFNKVALEAKASDILIVYISGHGINLGDQDGDFYYLTQDAYTANIDAYKDTGIRDKTTISSAEMTDLIRKVPALKQVLIIDACGSGKAVDNLMSKRDISSSTLRALDRMKDRTGLHIITGCAADAVSYEANRYGQGILTYSMLEGMKGASLRDDRFVDVVRLFQYGRERVPELAEGIGGIQQPQVFSPYGEASFDIGEIGPQDKTRIPLAQAKPIVIISSLKDKETFDDILGIEKMVDDKLSELSSKGKDAPFVFINAKEFPEAYKLRGQYAVSGNSVEVIVNIFKGSVKSATFVIHGVKADLEKLSADIVKKISF